MVTFTFFKNQFQNLLLGVVLFVSCEQSPSERNPALINNPKSATESSNNALAEISFNNTEHDFGKLIQGEKVVHIFKFTNKGNADLIVSSVSASCGCTASKYTKEPIKPGAEGKLEVTFNSEGQRGIQNKTITVITNGKPQTTILRLKAQVATPESF